MSTSHSVYVIGLTGNIATGKSTVARMLQQLGARVIDADKLAHRAMRAGTEVHERILRRFGEKVRASDGEIDRLALGAIVFTDSEALRALEEIVHPVVIDETHRRIAEATEPVCVVEAIKLLEAQMDRLCDAVWVVTSTHKQQVERLISDRHLAREDAEMRIDAQAPPENKVARADIVIDNAGTLDATRRQVEDAWAAIPVVRASDQSAARPHPPLGDHVSDEQAPNRALPRFARTVAAVLGRLLRGHPRLASWLVLSVGMIALLLWAAPAGGLAAGPLAVLILACVLLAGACAWIISWEGEERQP